jgi:peroxiredoxin
MEIDAKQQEIDKVKYVADRKGQFTDEFAPSYWRVNLGKENG